MDENANIKEIVNEYKRIDLTWLKLHFKTAIGLVVFACLLECTLGLTLFTTGAVEITLSKYVTKYIISPLALNLVLLAFGFWAIRSSKRTQNLKIYIISLMFAAICFVFYSVHRIFPSIYVIFTLPILLTVVYSNYNLTTVTALFSISAKIASELFVKWDPQVSNTLLTDYGLTDFFISISILFAFFAVCIIVIRFEKEKNNASILKEIERYHLNHRLLTDELTEINNRTALRKAFERMADDKEPSSYIFVMIDLDNFKLLNDTMGHDKGDQCLKDFGSILLSNCGNSASFRFGGDEFCILFKNQSMETVSQTCFNIKTDFTESIATCYPNLPLSASFGIARYSDDITTTQLLKKTDSALYCAKTAKNTIYIYDEDAFSSTYIADM